MTRVFINYDILDMDGVYKATINIKKVCIEEGKLPRRAAQLVLDWAELHQEDLIEDWELCQSKLQPNKIEPPR